MRINILTPALLTALIPAIIGAIPQYADWLKAWELQRFKVSANNVNTGIEQAALWTKNANCFRDTRPYITTTPMKSTVEVNECPTGDVLIRLIKDGERDKGKFWWFTSDSITKTETHFIHDVHEAFAEERQLHTKMLAQNGPVITCQQQTPDGFIRRVTQFPDGRCIEELINPYTGVVIKSQPIPCYSC